METPVTYDQKRRCLHCATKIPDNMHGTRKFCPRWVESDGSVKDCKSDYHAEQRVAEMEPHIKLAYALRDIDRSLNTHLKSNGSRIGLEDLNRMGVDLKTYARIHPNGAGLHNFLFPAFTLEQISSDTFKISSNELR